MQPFAIIMAWDILIYEYVYLGGLVEGGEREGSLDQKNDRLLAPVITTRCK